MPPWLEKLCASLSADVPFMLLSSAGQLLRLLVTRVRMSPVAALLSLLAAPLVGLCLSHVLRAAGFSESWSLGAAFLCGMFWRELVAGGEVVAAGFARDPLSLLVRLRRAAAGIPSGPPPGTTAGPGDGGAK